MDLIVRKGVTLTFKTRLFWTLSKVVLTLYFVFLRWPLVVFIWLISPFFGRIKKRISFEKSLKHTSATDNKKGICAFHVSSQGELEQSFPLIEKAINLANGDSFVEVIYTSMSVHQNILAIMNKYLIS